MYAQCCDETPALFADHNAGQESAWTGRAHGEASTSLHYERCPTTLEMGPHFASVIRE